MSKFARATTGVFALFAAYSLLETRRLKVQRFDVEIEKLPPEVEGLRVAQLSDFHRSAMSSRAMMRRAVALCNAQSPDVVVLTGDYVSRREPFEGMFSAARFEENARRYAHEIAADLGELRAPDGVWAIPGNHDSSVRESSVPDSEKRRGFAVLRALLEARGIGVLCNSSTRLRGVLPLIGLDDFLVGQPNLPRACAEISADEAQIFLSHNPRLIYAVRERNALMLSGHTHGGQVSLPLFPHRRLLDRRGDDFKVGWYQEGRARLYVTAGVGLVHLPFRFFCPPEIAVFALKNAMHKCCEHTHN